MNKKTFLAGKIWVDHEPERFMILFLLGIDIAMKIGLVRELL